MLSPGIQFYTFFHDYEYVCYPDNKISDITEHKKLRLSCYRGSNITIWYL